MYSSESIVRFAIYVRTVLVDNSDQALVNALRKVNLLLVPIVNVDRRLFLEYVSDDYAGRTLVTHSNSSRIRSKSLLKISNFFRKNVQGIDRDKIGLIYTAGNTMNTDTLLTSTSNWGLTREEIQARGIKNPSPALIANYRDEPRPGFLKEASNGIDLNRNWETNWDSNLKRKNGNDQAGANVTPQYYKYPGSSKQNATETINIEELLGTIISTSRPLKLVVDVHTGFNFEVTRSPSLIKDKVKNKWLMDYDFKRVTWRADKLVSSIKALSSETGILEAHAVDKVIGLKSEFSLGMELGAFHIEPMKKVIDGEVKVLIGAEKIAKALNPFFKELVIVMSN